MPANRFDGFTDYGVGIGLRIPHYDHILSEKPVVVSEPVSEFERTCAGKVRYPSQASADYLLIELQKLDQPRMRRESCGMKPYACKFCGWWHLGH